MGSASASVNATGIGIGFGKTYTDDNCVMLKNSREMWNYGMKAAALQLMCGDPANRKAIRETYVPGGFLCHGDTPPQTPEEKQAALAAKEAQQKQLRIAAAQATEAAQKASLAAKQASDAATAAAQQAMDATRQAAQANAQLTGSDASAASQPAVQQTSDAVLSRDSRTVSSNWPNSAD